jgi:hypothetical protein
MSTSPSSAPSPSISKSEYYSSLPWFRRLLAMLNWRPVVDYELREIEFERRKIAYEQSEREYEQRKIAHEQRMKQLEREDEQLRKEDERKKIAHEQRMKQLRSENARLAELNAKLSAISSSSVTNSNPAHPTPSESEM